MTCWTQHGLPTVSKAIANPPNLFHCPKELPSTTPPNFLGADVCFVCMCSRGGEPPLRKDQGRKFACSYFPTSDQIQEISDEVPTSKSWCCNWAGSESTAWQVWICLLSWYDHLFNHPSLPTLQINPKPRPQELGEISTKTIRSKGSWEATLTNFPEALID